MYPKAFIPAILLAGQAVNAVALPATTVTLHSVITRTTVVPATTEAAGSNPSNAATPARFSPSVDDTTVVALSSFSDASPSRMTQLTVTVTERVLFPVVVTVTKSLCPTSTSEMALSTSAVPSTTSSVVPSSTVTPSSSAQVSSKQTKSSTAPANTTTKACVFPIPGECDI
ncbi:unnamed protein product [Aureobasidium pullulans]|nr:hypothetical protein D6C88_09566 [Aureobasidium pullulans]TIA46848.1 hypothetical protein D6C79_04970 [Aureobasidium pullulans]TIA77044.1 hypothetical protein D6C76_05125 [Aureobasidium pullulans]CAC9890437.1 unnamed protein product [Aureobasidium pullulans]